MDVSLKQLVDDHINLSFILVLLAKNVSQWQQARDVIESMRFVRDALRYLADCPQLVHHPIENQLLLFSIQRNIITVDGYERFFHEHHQLESDTEAVISKIEDICVGDGGCTDDLALALKNELLRLIQAHQQHLLREEQELFPLLDKGMSKQDWQDFNKHLIQQGLVCEVAGERQSVESVLRSLVRAKGQMYALC